MPRPPTRQIEILSLLARYGVMSTKVLSQLLSDRVSDSWLRAALSSLEKKGLVLRGTSRIGGRPTSYWMIPNDELGVSRTMSLTGIALSAFRNKKAHWSQFPHENICTLFQATIERQMPSVWVLRESTRNFVQLPKHLLSARVKQNGYLPDLCLGVPHTSGAKRWIAVEIDRTNRSAKRVAARANIYSRHTSFSGLLYFMPNVRMVQKLNQIYNERGAKQSLRITGGNESFLASAVMPESLFDVNTLKVKCGAHEISISTWVALFSLAESHKRDDLLLRFSSNTHELEGPRSI